MFEFEVENDVLTSSVVEGSFDSNMKLGKITVMGISKIIKEVHLNTKEVKFEYDKEKMVSLKELLIIDIIITIFFFTYLYLILLTTNLFIRFYLWRI